MSLMYTQKMVAPWVSIFCLVLYFYDNQFNESNSISTTYEDVSSYIIITFITLMQIVILYSNDDGDDNHAPLDDMNSKLTLI